MRLAQFSPRLLWIPTGQGYTHELTFDCPTCGPPYLVSARCLLDGPASGGVWSLKLPPEPRGDGWEGVTVTPSISNHHHGRKKTCTFHGTIIDGAIVS